MSISGRIKILGKTFTVLPETSATLKDEHGETLISSQLIRYRSDDHPETQRDTLLHEVLHGVELQLYLKLTETQVHGLTVGLLQVIRDNQEFIQWLQEDVRSE